MRIVHEIYSYRTVFIFPFNLSNKHGKYRRKYTYLVRNITDSCEFVSINFQKISHNIAIYIEQDNTIKTSITIYRVDVRGHSVVQRQSYFRLLKMNELWTNLFRLGTVFPCFWEWILTHLIFKNRYIFSC